jgi:hypothetical protein
VERVWGREVHGGCCNACYCFACRTSRKPRYALQPHPSPLTPHPSPLTPHPSPLTPRPSPLAPRPSPLDPQALTLNPEPSCIASDSCTCRSPVPCRREIRGTRTEPRMKAPPQVSMQTLSASASLSASVSVSECAFCCPVCVYVCMRLRMCVCLRASPRDDDHTHGSHIRRRHSLLNGPQWHLSTGPQCGLSSTTHCVESNRLPTPLHHKLVATKCSCGQVVAGPGRK